jgi:hypothetical protein
MTGLEMSLGFALIGVLGLGGGKMWNNKDKLTKAVHDEFCGLKLTPIKDALERIEDKIDDALKKGG